MRLALALALLLPATGALALSDAEWSAGDGPYDQFVQDTGCGLSDQNGLKLHQALLGTQVTEAAHYELYGSKPGLAALLRDMKGVLVVDNYVSNNTSNAYMIQNDEWPQRHLDLPGWAPKR